MVNVHAMCTYVTLYYRFGLSFYDINTRNMQLDKSCQGSLGMGIRLSLGPRGHGTNPKASEM